MTDFPCRCDSLCICATDGAYRCACLFHRLCDRGLGRSCSHDDEHDCGSPTTRGEILDAGRAVDPDNAEEWTATALHWLAELEPHFDEVAR